MHPTHRQSNWEQRNLLQSRIQIKAEANHCSVIQGFGFAWLGPLSCGCGASLQTLPGSIVPPVFSYLFSCLRVDTLCRQPWGVSLLWKQRRRRCCSVLDTLTPHGPKDGCLGGARESGGPAHRWTPFPVGGGACPPPSPQGVERFRGILVIPPPLGRWPRRTGTGSSS